MKYPSYPSYPDVAAETDDWIGAIPSQWMRMSLKRKFRLVNGSTPSSDPEYWDGGIVWITPADFRNTDAGYFSTSARTITLDGLNSCGTSLVPTNSIVITTRAPIGGVAQGKVEFCSNQGCKSLALDAHDVHERFVYYVLDASSPQLNALGLGSTFMELSTQNLGMYPLPLPPLPEQKQIAAFLDWKTGQIDALIARKKELLEKLQEKRLAVITQAVTRGLSPNVPFRDSGLSWVGEIPRHWELRKAKFSCEAIVDCKNRTPDYFDDGEFYVVRTTDVKDGRLNLADAQRTDKENFDEWTERGAPREGDVLFTREAPAGEAAFFDGKAPICLGQRMMYFRVDRKQLDPNYLLAYIYSLSLRAYIDSESGGSTVTHLRLGQVYNLPVIQPPLEEQVAISAHLDATTSKIASLTEKVESAIARLIEYRAALITAATTGKIDVRNVKIPESAVQPCHFIPRAISMHSAATSRRITTRSKNPMAGAS